MPEAICPFSYTSHRIVKTEIQMRISAIDTEATESNNEPEATDQLNAIVVQLQVKMTVNVGLICAVFIISYVKIKPMAGVRATTTTDITLPYFKKIVCCTR